jgi:flagellar protein FliS
MPVTGKHAVDAYAQTEAVSRTSLELVVMLYDGALRFTAQARDAIERKDIRGRQIAIARTQAILSQLQSTLDMEKGAAIARSLDGLYVYIGGRLLDASIKQDVEPIDEAAKLLTTLREAWTNIAGAEAAPARAAR